MDLIRQNVARVIDLTEDETERIDADEVGQLLDQSVPTN